MRKLERTRSPHRPTGLSFRSRTVPSPSTHPAHGPQVTAFFEENEHSSSPLRLCGAASQTVKPVGFFRAVRGRHRRRKGPTRNLPHTASLPPAAPPRRRVFLRALEAAPPPNSRARDPNPGVAGRRAHAPESRSCPRAAAPGTKISGPGTRTSAATRIERSARRAHAPARSYKQARPRASITARSCAAPTESTARPSPTQGAGAREPRDVLRSGATPRSLGPSGSCPPAPARRCVGWARCLRPAASPHPFPYWIPHPATSPPPPPPPLYPPAPPHSLGAPVLPSPLQDRQDFPLTAPWAPSYIQPSQPIGAECSSRDNLSVGSRET